MLDRPDPLPLASLELLPPAKTPSLAELAKQARAALANVKNAFSNAVEHALRAGKALNAAKLLVPEGQWLKWLRAECDLSERSAQLYMQLARALEEDPQRVADWADLSLRAAVKRLTPATPRNQPPGMRKPKGRQPVTTAGWDSMAFTDAPLPEQRKHLDAIGARVVLAAMPLSWIPAVRLWLETVEGKPVAAAPVSTSDDLDIPGFLRRDPPRRLN